MKKRKGLHVNRLDTPPRPNDSPIKLFLHKLCCEAQ